MKKLLALAFMAIFLAGCKTVPPRPSVSAVEIQDIRCPGSFHTVRSGETLWKISKLYGVDIESLLGANSLRDDAILEKGQVLVIPSERAAKTAVKNYLPKDSFVWPVRGSVISSFGAKIDKSKNKGIDISVSEGRSIRAARSGVVVFYDEKMKGFGKTVILDHGDSYQTVYAYNSDILVRPGDRIEQNDVIARAGRTGRAKQPCLHFEIRKDGECRNPLHYLPR